MSTQGQVTVNVTDGSVNANALIDVAGRIESRPVPKPLPNDPLNPGTTIALTSNHPQMKTKNIYIRFAVER